MRRRAQCASVLLGLLVTGCSFTPEDAAAPLAERAIENRIENELGEDVDLDLDDNGSISLEGSQGGSDFRVEFDPETKEVVIVRDGVEQSVSLDRENGTINVDGVGALDIPDIGDLDPSSAEITDWPAEVPLPDGQVIDTTEADDQFFSVLTLSILPTSGADQLFESYRDALLADGFELLGDETSGDDGLTNRVARLARDPYSIMVSVVDGGAVQLATVSLSQPK